jgi:hypothetical protein
MHVVSKQTTVEATLTSAHPGRARRHGRVEIISASLHADDAATLVTAVQSRVEETSRQTGRDPGLVRSPAHYRAGRSLTTPAWRAVRHER